MFSFLTRPASCLFITFAALIQSGWGSWQYTGTTPDGDFAYTATYDQTAGGAYEGTASITGYTGSSANVVIPSSVSFTANPSGQNVTVNCIVTEIQQNWGQPGVFADKAFITNVEIPQSVTGIGSASFYQCTGLTSIDIPASVTAIGGAAFYGCTGLTGVQLHEGISSLAENVFANCSSLTQISLPSTITYTGGRWHAGSYYSTVFGGCSSLKNVTIYSGADIANGTFSKLPNLETVAYIGPSINGNPTDIGYNAFEQCPKLNSITLATNTTSIGDRAFAYCPMLTALTLPVGLVSIGNDAFYQCQELESISIPTTVTQIGNSAFYFCSKLTAISIPHGVTTIASETFGSCGNLSSVTIPSTVASIGRGAFAGCSKLASLTLPVGITTIDSEAFVGCGLESIEIPPGIARIGDFVFAGCKFQEIEVPNEIVTIGYHAFYGCSLLTKVTLPSTLTTIEGRAFGYCNLLSEISIPGEVTTIQSEAFWNCPLLRAAIFQGNSPTMQTNVFSGSPVACYHLPAATGFTSPTWQGYPCGIAVPYGGTLSTSASSSFFLYGGTAADGPVTLQAPTCEALSLHQRQTTPVAVHFGAAGLLRLGSSGILEVELGYGPMTIGSVPNAGTLTAGGTVGANGTLILNNASTNDLTVNAEIANNGSGEVGLSKTGSGRAILNARNNYSGNTSVTGGTLVLKSTCLVETSSVSISSGGVLKLDYIGTDMLNGLTLNGIAKPNGLYDSTNSGGLITGTGKIQVGPFADFTAWSAAIAPGQTVDQDHDQDGVANGIEYFMGKSGSDFTANPGIATDGTVTWAKSPAFNGSYAVQTSENLKDWIEVTEDAGQVTQNPDSVIWTRPDGPESLFVRLLVTPN